MIKMWVDKETWMPLRIEMYNEKDNKLRRVEYKDTVFNTNIQDGEFEFKIPNDAIVKNIRYT